MTYTFEASPFFFFFFFFFFTVSVLKAAKIWRPEVGREILQSFLVETLTKHFTECETKPFKSFKYKLSHAPLILVINVSFSNSLFHFTLLLATDQNYSIGLGS